MHSTHRLVAFAALAFAASGCGPAIEVRTIVAPDARFSNLHTFRVMRGPRRRDGHAVSGSDDPMVDNTIANRAIRQRLIKAFQDRGYTLADSNPDFGVAFYATTHQKLDVTLWDYGYPFYPRWWVPPPAETITQYTEGTVIVDAVDISRRELLWRGEGRAVLSDDPSEDVKRLAEAAAKVAEKFPRASSRAVSAGP